MQDLWQMFLNSRPTSAPTAPVVEPAKEEALRDVRTDKPLDDGQRSR